MQIDIEEEQVMLEIQCTEYKKKEQIMDGLEFDGLNDLVDGLENAVSKYPDLAEASLKESKEILKDMIRETWSAVDKHTGNLVRGFRFSAIRGNRSNMETDFYAEGVRKVRIFIWSIMVMKW